MEPIHFTNRRRPGDEIAMDCFDFSLDNEGYKYVLVLVDVMTLFVWACPLRTKRNEEVMRFLEETLVENNFHCDLRMDNGGEFRGFMKHFHKFWSRGHSHIKRIYPGNSRSNVSNEMTGVCCG